jgi:hypothetical protein
VFQLQLTLLLVTLSLTSLPIPNVKLSKKLLEVAPLANMLLTCAIKKRLIKQFVEREHRGVLGMVRAITPSSITLMTSSTRVQLAQKARLKQTWRTRLTSP